MEAYPKRDLRRRQAKVTLERSWRSWISADTNHRIVIADETSDLSRLWIYPSSNPVEHDRDQQPDPLGPLDGGAERFRAGTPAARPSVAELAMVGLRLYLPPTPLCGPKIPRFKAGDGLNPGGWAACFLGVRGKVAHDDRATAQPNRER